MEPDSDRLSNLPEGILIYILRRMEIRDAIRTSVLSKEWTRLWTQLPSIFIDADSFDDFDSFRFFLFGLFTHYDASKLYSVRFRCSDEEFEFDDRIVETIIDYATSNRAEHLWIKCPSTSATSIQLSPKLATCRSLRGLILERLSCQFPTPFFCASLTTVSLDGVCVENDILWSCMNLETFFMMDCAVYGLTRIVISSPKLVKLDIQYERLDECPEETLVLISAPKLESLAFSIHCDSILNISVDKCPSLESVWVGVYRDPTVENAEDIVQKRTCATHLLDFLKGVSDSRSFTFSSDVIKALSACPELVKGLPSPFHNLKYLEIYKDRNNQYVDIPQEVKTFLVGEPPNDSKILKGLLV